MGEDKKEEKKETPANGATPNEHDSAQIILDLKKQVEDLTSANKDLKKAQADFYDKILNGGSDPAQPATTHRPIEDIRKDLINSFSDDKEPTNLAYCKLILELDDAVREDTGESVFLPKGHDVTPKVDEYATADKFHDLLKYAIEASEGNPISFNAELEKHIKQPSPIRKK